MIDKYTLDELYAITEECKRVGTDSGPAYELFLDVITHKEAEEYAKAEAEGFTISEDDITETTEELVSSMYWALE